MVLVDSSVWIDHFRWGRSDLAEHLSDGDALGHPSVVGELACGNLKGRTTLLSHLNALLPARVATDAEVLRLIEDRQLWGRGLGWIDVHLVAAALLSHCAFWTLDARLRRAADDLGLM